MFKQIAEISIVSFLGAVAGNLAYHLVESGQYRQQVAAGTIYSTNEVGAVWVPHAALAATLVAARNNRRPRTLGFLLALVIALIAAALDGKPALPATPPTVVAR